VSRAEHDVAYMRLAIAEAIRALGRTHPNPAVGAVVVKGGKIVGRGWTRPPGGPHAEIVALKAAGKKAKGATLYTTLEPCNHFGRTPPCSDAILKAGVKRVVYGSLDPNPKVNGAGLRKLRRGGVEVKGPVLRQETEALNRPFFKLHRSGLPWVTLKAAITLDGKLATAERDSRWVSSGEARTLGHELRDRVDAIMVGAGTVKFDDPRLTTRLSPKGRDPTRVVLDARLSTSPRSQVYRQRSDAQTIIVTAQGSQSAAARRYAPAQVWKVPRDAKAKGQLNLRAVLERLAGEGMLHVLVEGGAELHSSFLKSGLWDELLLFIAPKLVGHEGLTWTGKLAIGQMAQAITLGALTVEPVGPDLLLHVLR
jgi:diaminohydroxyphosphoribosylaminopyrimidine deaminase/5-amino-6-(5-phosphoribosylamino)uracil reductase